MRACIGSIENRSKALVFLIVNRIASRGPRIYFVKGACISPLVRVGLQILPGYFPIPTTCSFNVILHLFKCISRLELNDADIRIRAQRLLFHEAICHAIEERISLQIFQFYCILFRLAAFSRQRNRYNIDSHVNLTFCRRRNNLNQRECRSVISSCNFHISAISLKISSFKPCVTSILKYF